MKHAIPNCLILLGLLSQLQGQLQAQTETPDLSKNQDHNQVMYATWQYTSVAKACGHEEFRELRGHLVEFVRFQEEKGLLTDVGKLYFGNQNQMDRFIDQSVEQYRRQPSLSCSSAVQYYQPLMEAIRRMVRSG